MRAGQERGRGAKAASHSRLGLLNKRADASRRRVKGAEAVVLEEEEADPSKAVAPPRGGGGARAEPGGSKLLRRRRAPAGTARAAADSRKATAVAGQPLAPAVNAGSLGRTGAGDRAGRNEGQADGMTGERCRLLYTSDATEPAAGRLELATWLVTKSRTGMAAPARSGRGQSIGTARPLAAL